MLPPLPYHPFATRMVVRSAIIWIGIRALVTGLAGGVLLEWEAAFIVGLLVGGLSYGDAARCHEPLFLRNCGVPLKSLLFLTYAPAFILELALFAAYSTWITS